MNLRRAFLVPLTVGALLLTSCAATGSEAGSASPSEDACRNVEDANGTVCVPADPQRVVVLDPLMALPTLIDLGVPVVGAATVYADGVSFPDYIDDADLAGIETVGAMQDPSLEAIAALEPDLIISGSSSGSSESAGDLADIAPVLTVPYSFYRSEWLDDVRSLAEAVGKSDEAEKQIDEYEAHAADVADALAAQGPEHTLTRVDIYEGSPLYYRSGCTWFGSVLSAAGVTQPAAQGPDSCTQGDYQSTIVYLSLEDLSVLDSDAIVGYQQQSTASAVGANPLDELSGNALWQALPAVQDGKVFVEGDAWGLGVSLQAANAVLDDLATIFPAS